MEASSRRPDARRSLPLLREEWEACRACNLGEQREAIRGSLVFGEGAMGGVMLIGEGPGREEEAEGRPFVGASGRFLRSTLEAIGLRHYYITNAVCCRSWVYDYDSEGKPRIDFKTKAIRRKDSPPNMTQMNACFQRLLEEIYVVDPVLIVTLGGSAAEVLLRRSVTLQKDSGELQSAVLPGALLIPSLTDVARKWARWVGPKESRQLIMPFAQNTVVYPLLPLYHPAYVMAYAADKRPGSPMNMFATGMMKARDIYLRYMQEIGGENVTEYETTEDDIYEAQLNANSDSHETSNRDP